MKKLLLCSMMVFLMPVIASAASEKFMEVIFGSKGNVSAENIQVYTKTATYTGKPDTDIAGKTWTVANFNNNNNSWADMIKCGNKTAASTGSVASDFAVNERVSQVVVSLAVNYDNVTSISLYSSTDKTTWTEVAKNTSISKSTTSVSLNTTNPTENLYYKVDFVCSKASSNGVVSLKNITYYAETGDPSLLPAGLSFGETTEFNVVLGDEFTAPGLLNPNNLPVTYASSNEEVAMVDDKTGEVVLMDSPGTTTISAAFAGDDTYNSQTVSYNLTVIKTYKSIAEFNTLADGESGIIDFVSTVAYVNGKNMYITDGTDFTLIFSNANFTGYEAGDKIPTGWDAKMKIYNGLPEIDNPTLPAVTEKGTFTAANVESVNTSMLNAIVVLKNVTFAATTASGATKKNFDGTVGDATYTFRNNFADVASVPAGTYDVTIAVNIYDGGKTVISTDASKLQLYPISYEVVPVAPSAPELLINGSAASGDINTTDGELTFEVPEGISVYYLIEANNANDPVEPEDVPAKAAPATMENDGKVYNLYTGAVKLEGGNHTLSYFAYDDATGLKSDVKTVNVSNTVGIEGIAAEDGETVWFNLQGVRVTDPQHGIYVRVAGGKAAKVVME